MYVAKTSPSYPGHLLAYTITQLLPATVPLVGVAGFEPADAGVKVLCLIPLGDTPEITQISTVRCIASVALFDKSDKQAGHSTIVIFCCGLSPNSIAYKVEATGLSLNLNCAAKQ